MVGSAENRILDAAEKLFAERGYVATTTRALADAAGVNEVTLFRSFGSKMGVLRGVFDRVGVAELRRDVDAGATPPDAREALLELARREVLRTIEHGVIALRVSFDARTVPELAELVGAGPAENLKSLAQLFERWQATGQIRPDLDPRVLAEAFSSITTSVVMYRHVMGVDPTEGMDMDEVTRQLTDVLLEGVLVRD